MTKTYVYTAMDATGQQYSDLIEADDEQHAQKLIRGRGLFVCSLRKAFVEIEDIANSQRISKSKLTELRTERQNGLLYLFVGGFFGFIAGGISASIVFALFN